MPRTVCLPGPLAALTRAESEKCSFEAPQKICRAGAAVGTSALCAKKNETVTIPGIIVEGETG